MIHLSISNEHLLYPDASTVHNVHISFAVVVMMEWTSVTSITFAKIILVHEKIFRPTKVMWIL